MGPPKIKTIEELSFLIEKLKAQKKKIVMAHGDFDLLRYDHLHYLKESKNLGDILVVSLVADKFMRKGLEKPIFDENTRAELIALIGCVDYIVICQYFGPWDIIKRLKPHIYTKSENVSSQLKDQNSGVSRDKSMVESVGGVFAFTKTISNFSADIHGGYGAILPDKTLYFLTEFRKKYQVADIFLELEKLKSIKALVIGETIIDEYRFVNPLGKPGKSYNVSTQFLSKEEFVGGAAALANHASSLCGFVDLITCLGNDSKESFIRGRLSSNVCPLFFRDSSRPTIIKRRFVDNDSLTKIFEEYECGRKFLSFVVQNEVEKYLKEILENYDLVIAVDYGHGFFSPDIIKTIVSGAKFLAVNAQTNSGNAGFNYITKYPKGDYVCIDEQEARLAVQDDASDIEEILLSLYKKMDVKKMVVTLGRRGSLAYEKGVGFVKVPALAINVTDPVGAGDASLAISAPCAAAGFPLELICFMGNIAGSIAVNILGNESSVEHETLFKRIGYFLPD